MRWSVKLIVLLCVAGLAVALFVKRSSRPHQSGAPDVTSSPASSTSASQLLARAEATPGRNAHGRDFLKRAHTRSLAGSGVITNDPAGLQKIGSILEASGSDRDKARRLLELAPALPEEEQMEAADHAANLVTDADYDVLKAVLVQAESPEPVIDELLSDLLRRGNSLKLPTLVEIASQPNHPRVTEARDLLELHVGEDHGNDWPAWQAAIRTHIAEHGE